MEQNSVDDEWASFLNNEILNKNKPIRKSNASIINTNNINTGIEKDCIDKNDGINNMKYTYISTDTIFDKHKLINVKS